MLGRYLTITSIFRDFFPQYIVLWFILFSNNEGTLNAIEGTHIKCKGCSTTVPSNKIVTSHIDI